MIIRSMAAVFLSLAAICASGQTVLTSTPQMSHEEQVVRTTYARLAYAVQVTEVHEAIYDSESTKKVVDHAGLAQRLKNVEITFELSDFKVGNVTDDDIGQTLYSALVTKPSGGMGLAIGTVHSNFSTDSPPNGSQVPQHTQSVGASAKWQQEQNITQEDWDIPWSKAFPLTENYTWFTRYAAFKVKVGFQGRFREYRAMFTFGHDPKTGAEYIDPVDTVTNLMGGALFFFANHGAYPEALIEGGIGRDIPAVHDWLRAQASGGRQHEDNCGIAKCGVSQQDLRKLESLPHKQMKAIPPRKPRVLNAVFPPPMQSDCSSLTQKNPHVNDLVDFQRHVAPGFHELRSAGLASCIYTSGNTTNCDSSCQIRLTLSEMTENPPTAGFCHQVNSNREDDTDNGMGGASNCAGAVGGGVKECALCKCEVTVSISKSRNGGQAGVSISSDGFYTAKDPVSQSCPALADPTVASGGGGGGGNPGGCDGGQTNNGLSDGGGSPGDCPPSPIIIDTEGQGFHLTSAANGVPFDIRGTGTPIQIAWTEAGTQNGFLALPDASGHVLDGRHLFGNFTPQPTSPHPNGFLALAIYDQPDHGGNGDGIIDAHDAIYSKLRIWIDKNHDGIAQPDELFTLPQIGVVSLSLDYSFSYREDQYGNQFRYRAKANPHHHRGDNKEEDEVGPWAYDVFFVTK